MKIASVTGNTCARQYGASDAGDFRNVVAKRRRYAGNKRIVRFARIDPR
jgi:hypothetical protein